MEITNAIWFTQMGGPLIGIVVGKDINTREMKAYIGTASGTDEDFDAEKIVKMGARLYLSTARSLVHHLQEKED